jgi:hypothetical protein
MEPTPSEDQVNLAKAVAALLSDHPDWYIRFDVGLCLQREGDHIAVRVGAVHGILESETALPEETLDYGDIILTRFRVPPDRFETFMNNLMLRHTITHPSLGETKFNGYFRALHKQPLSYYRKESQRPWEYGWNAWPCYYLQVEVREVPPISDHALVRPGLPLYPNWYAGACDVLRIGENLFQLQGVQGIFIELCDPRARLANLSLRGKAVTIELANEAEELDKLLIKLFAAYDSKGSLALEKAVELRPATKTISHQLPGEPNILSVHLVDSKTGEDLDWRDVFLTWERLPGGVTVERAEESLIEILRRGESDTVEHKIALDEKGLQDRLPRAVCSFANSRGGVVFLGTNDEGVPSQTFDMTQRDRVSQILSENIEPPPIVEFSPVTAEGFQLLAVIVREGSEKPYVVKNRGVFIRYSGTTRHATRAELLALTKKEPSAFSF